MNGGSGGVEGAVAAVQPCVEAAMEWPAAVALAAFFIAAAWVLTVAMKEITF